MNKTIIVYESKYGATKKYAEWLAQELNCDLFSKKDVSPAKIGDYNTVIYGGGIYASGIAGISFLKKNDKLLHGKKIIIFAVGASPYNENAFDAVKKKNLTDSLAAVPCFYLRGAFNEKVMSFGDRVLIGMLKKAVSKKDPAQYEPWQKALMETIGQAGDWTSKENLTPLLEYLKSV